MSFLTRINLIAGPDNYPITIATWVSQNDTFIITDEIIDDNNTVQERNITVLGTLHSAQQNYKTFNGTRGHVDGFVAMNSPWFLIYVIATDSKQNKEPHILCVGLGTKPDATTS